MSETDDLFAVGTTLDLGSHTFTAEAIKAFARKYDPQLFHVDEEKAADSMFGGLCASGWHTAAVAMRLNVDARRAQAERRVAAGRPAPRMGPSPGVRNLGWPRPVYAGDTVRFSQTITGRRASDSQPGWEVIEFATLGVNAAGETVFSFDGAAFAADLG